VLIDAYSGQMVSQCAGSVLEFVYTPRYVLVSR
jgi:hypothetical protein